MPSKKTFVDKTVKSLTPEQVKALIASRWGEDQTLAANPDTYARLMGRDADGFQLNAGGGQSSGGDTEGGFTGKYNDFTRAGTTISRKRADGLFDAFDENGNYLSTSNDGNAWSAKDWATFAAIVAGAGAATGSFGAAGASGAGASGGTTAGTTTLGELGTFTTADLGMGATMAESASGIGAAGAGAGGTVSIGGLGEFGLSDLAMSPEMVTGSSGVGAIETGGTSLLTDAGKELGEKAATETAKDAIDKPTVTKDGFELLTRAGGTLIASGVIGDALSDPVNTSRYDQLFDNLLSEQKIASQRGTDLWADYQKTWRPIQQKFADTVLGYDTPERRESAANAATGEVAQQYDIERTQAQRDLEAAGVDPSTIYALGTASRLDEAKAKAAAANNARDNTEKTGLNLLQGAVNQGNTVVSQGTQQSQVATGNTQAASGILNAQGNQQNQNTQNRNAMIGDLFGAATTAYGMYTSSKKTKHVGGKVDGLAAAKAVEKSPAKKWSYKDGQGDGNTKARMGPMAEDLKRVAPQVSNGKQVDAISQLGLHHAAIGALSKQMGRIEKKLGSLADARRA